MVARIEITSREFIRPSNPIPHSLNNLKFSFLDQIVGPCYIPLIFFYQNHPASNVDHAQKSQLLKQSLSDVLTKFYPLAGRVEGDVSINCDDSGALYVEAQVHDHLSQAIQVSSLEEINQYLPLDPYSIETNDLSCKDVALAVQISFFECGGTAVGVCISHKIGDLCSLVTFMNAWATVCRGETEIPQPNFGLGYNLFPPKSFPADGLAAPSAEIAGKKFVTKRLVFNKEKLVELKELASLASDDSQVRIPTRVEAISAFIWKQVIDVTKAKTDAQTRFAAAQVVNLRPRMSPPLPDDTMGNFTIRTGVFITPDKDKDYHNLAGLIGQAIRKITNVRNGVDFFSEVSKLEEEFSKPELGFFWFSSWCRFPVYKVDYGWDKPISVCTATFSESGVILMSTRYGEGIDAWISMEEDDMAMLPIEFLALENNDLISK